MQIKEVIMRIRQVANKEKGGFTLVSILIYSAIVTGMLTFAIVTTYQVINSSDLIVDVRELTENQKFLLQKTAWVLQSADTINSPALGASGSSLSVNKLDFAFNPLMLGLDSGVVELTSGATVTPVTNSYVTVENLNFEYIDLASSTNAIRITADLSNGNATTSIDSTIITR